MNLLRKLDLMRMVVGICIVIDGYPIIFFLKETLRLAPSSTAFTAAVMLLGFVLMIPFSFLNKLYRPNITLFWLSIVFIGICIFYMYVYTGNPFFNEQTKDLIYYFYIFLFLFLLINVPNDIIEVFIPVVIAFTVVSNLALVYALVTDPTWAIGQRAAIQYGSDDDRQGNPHVFARNALMCVIACGIWAARAKTGFVARLLAIFATVFSMAILVMTMTRSSILALILVVLCFLFFNIRPAQVRAAFRSLLRPIPMITIGVAFFAIAYFIQRNATVYGILYGYFISFIERNLENVYALLGLQSTTGAYKATLDASAANRSVSFMFLSNVLEGHLYMLILGSGYKFLYLDVPIVEALINHGFVGFIPYAAFVGLASYYAVQAMRHNYNPVSVFMGYFFVYFFVMQFTGGRPYEISFWHPFCMVIRFFGVEELLPRRLWSSAL